MLARNLIVTAIATLALVVGSDRAEAEGFIEDLTHEGVALAIWDGGSVDDLPTLHPNVSSVWVTVDGELVGYIPLAPTFVNQDFLTLYPAGTVPEGTPMLATVTGPALPVGAGPPPDPTPGPRFTAIPPRLHEIVNAELAGFASTTDDEPLAPARGECSTDEEHLLGWGWPNGTEVIVIGVGISDCDGWTYLRDETGATRYWLENRFVNPNPS